MTDAVFNAVVTHYVAIDLYNIYAKWSSSHGFSHPLRAPIVLQTEMAANDDYWRTEES
ncbi:hypothetical protein CANTEDRAFT_112566 [Yamadazyma tenuis ATCC 10573]|uniref:Uncharacterized protein n=1 Tax=Candida tenuis (strain ATCC 10573 / BCRC 21748 / CBS 615 / JCM 9827 / NBRC 10315 / NRRL Y-1498 / VKM Y-70) TaxID=590646 RepID=G3AXV5_CANTC|nr:uncharacterized protein CANTEDRAFT_112566 [Yamadazyma tenuis ATCC 10573]EGV65703.1 hypothetical protein CANTEDRAFT_112566 [Yamadazyma tenuis ATCC 10573]